MTTLQVNLFLFVITLKPLEILAILTTSSSNLKLTPLSAATSAYEIESS